MSSFEFPLETPSFVNQREQDLTEKPLATSDNQTQYCGVFFAGYMPIIISCNVDTSLASLTNKARLQLKFHYTAGHSEIPFFFRIWNP